MFKAVKIDSDLVWVNPKTRGRVEQNVPNPTQFFRVLVVADVGGRKVFLDPTDRTLAFGKLKPSMEGVPCLIIDKKKQEWSTTSVSSADDSTRAANLQFTIDEEGRVAGTGRLELTGNHAWSRLGWRDSEDATKTAWTGWIEDAYAGFDIDEVGVTEAIEEQRVAVTWEMRQRDDDVIGNEVSLLPAEPLAVGSNPYTLPPNQRWTPKWCRSRYTAIVEELLRESDDMTRPNRIVAEGGVYHVHDRLGRGERVFDEETEAAAFVGLLRDVVERDGLTVFAWTLMPSHFHLAARTAAQRRRRGPGGGDSRKARPGRAWTRVATDHRSGGAHRSRRRMARRGYR